MKKLLFYFCVPVLLVSSASCSNMSRTPVAQQDEVYNIGYGTVMGDVNTASVSNVKVKKREAVTYTNMKEYLRGRVPGLSIDASGQITIRGISTINGDPTPLFIVDGVEVPDIDNIDPRLVKSVDVIKDGSSAIYGAKGGNGVIIITLKKVEDYDDD